MRKNLLIFKNSLGELEMTDFIFSRHDVSLDRKIPFQFSGIQTTRSLCKPEKRFAEETPSSLSNLRR